MTDNDNPPAATPAGWYPDGADASVVRYWDGAQWTDQTQPAAGYVGSGTPGTAATGGGTIVATEPKPKRKLKWWHWTLIGTGALLLLVIIIGSLNRPDTAGDADPDAGVSQPAEEEPAAAEQVTVPDVVGLTLAEARVAMESAGLTVAVDSGAAEDDVVERQSVSGGREVDEGTEVTITVAEVKPGSLESPHPKGYTASVYQGSPENALADISVAIKDPNANAAIAQANQFNDPPQPGYHYVAVEYTVTGASKTEPANVSMLLYDWTLSQSDGVQIAESNTTVVLPDGWNQTYDVNDLYQGQTGTAVVIYQVPDAYTGPLYATAYGEYITL